MENDLMERYLYAVTRHLSPKQRADVARELRGLIEDMLAERCAGAKPTERDLRVVLTELGPPGELARKYDPAGDRALIGLPYFGLYKRVLETVLVCMAVGMTLAQGILALLEPGTWYLQVGRWLSGLAAGAVGAFAFVTALFAFFSWRGVALEQYNFDDLPPVPKKRQAAPVWESMAGIGFCVVFLVIFLGCPQIFSMPDGTPLLSATAIRSTWPVPVLLAALGIGRETVKLLERRYSRRVFLTALLADGLSAALMIWWLGAFPVFNPAFFEKIAGLFPEDPGFFTFFERFPTFFLAVFLFALALDVLDAFLRSREA